MTMRFTKNISILLAELFVGALIWRAAQVLDGQAWAMIAGAFMVGFPVCLSLIASGIFMRDERQRHPPRHPYRVQERPQLSAPTVIVVDSQTGEIVQHRPGHAPRPVAYRLDADVENW